MNHQRSHKSSPLVGFYTRLAPSIQRVQRRADPALAPDREANQKPEADLPFFFFDALERFDAATKKKKKMEGPLCH